MTAEQLNTQIDQLEQKFTLVVGRECDVYSRVVGYYQPVRNWNKGKSQEFAERVTFKLPKAL
jgi:ribonucleoside-triphosphate reductase